MHRRRATFDHCWVRVGGGWVVGSFVVLFLCVCVCDLFLVDGNWTQRLDCNRTLL